MTHICEICVVCPGYGVAAISRLLKIIGLFCKSRLLQIMGLFCKRALYKRLHSAKETYHFKEPIHRSHPICINTQMCVTNVCHLWV